MKVVSPSVELITPLNGAVILKRLEQCGRVSYKTEDKITETSAPKFISMIIKSGHESVLEHCSITVKWTCDRGVSHELVRHRLASYTQESTRYCNYSKDKFNNEIAVIKPINLKNTEQWEAACMYAETMYFAMLANGDRPEDARSVLPTCLKTEVAVTMNIREWRHFFKLRCANDAHPDIRYLANKTKEMFCEDANLAILFEGV